MLNSILYHLVLVLLLLSSLHCAKDTIVSSPGTGFIPNNQDGNLDPDKDGKTNTEQDNPELTESLTEYFRGSFLQKQDFLFVIDNSGSMSGEIKAVKENVGNFVSELQKTRTVDYQAGIVTTDAQANNGGLVKAGDGISVVQTNQTAYNPVVKIQDIISRIPANGASSTTGMEMGLEAAYLALQNNSSLLRAGVPLAVITLSDEQDHSCHAGDSACLSEARNNDDPLSGQGKYALDSSLYVPKSFYIDFFKNIGRTALFYPIVGLRSGAGLNTAQCSDIMSLGTRYVEVQAGIGTGFSSSICLGDSNASQLKAAFTSIGTAISKRGICYPLSRKATGNGVSVVVDGVAAPNNRESGYLLDRPANAICFPVKSPPEGASITVTYGAYK